MHGLAGSCEKGCLLCVPDQVPLLGKKDRDGARLHVQGIETEGSEIVSVKGFHPCQRRAAPTTLT